MSDEEAEKVKAWLEYMRQEGRRHKDHIKTLACQFALDALSKESPLAPRATPHRPAR